MSPSMRLGRNVVLKMYSLRFWGIELFQTNLSFLYAVSAIPALCLNAVSNGLSQPIIRRRRRRRTARGSNRCLTTTSPPVSQESSVNVIARLHEGFKWRTKLDYASKWPGKG